VVHGVNLGSATRPEKKAIMPQICVYKERGGEKQDWGLPTRRGTRRREDGGSLFQQTVESGQRERAIGGSFLDLLTTRSTHLDAACLATAAALGVGLEVDKEEAAVVAPRRWPPFRAAARNPRNSGAIRTHITGRNGEKRGGHARGWGFRSG
jgi:hypothetical protein